MYKVKAKTMRTINEVKQDMAKLFEKLDKLEAEARSINLAKWKDRYEFEK